MSEKLHGERSPQDLVAEFVGVVQLISTPPASPLEERAQAAAGGRLIFRSFDLRGDTDRAVPDELAERIQRRADGLLELVSITGSFRAYLSGLVGEGLTSGMMRMIAAAKTIKDAGIDLQSGKLGIFDPDPSVVQVVEREAIRVNYPNPYMVPAMARAHNAKMDRWVKDYTDTYGENPLE